MNILLVADESAGVQALKMLGAAGHRLVGVAASPNPHPDGYMTVWRLAEEMGCRRWPAEALRDPGFEAVIRAERVDLLLNVHSLYVLPGEVVSAPAIGSFNLHPGPLPRYAGLNAPSWAIYHGEKRHGVTVHWMLPGIDTGPIAYQTLFDIEDGDTGLLLSVRCARAGLDLMRGLLATAARDPGAIPSYPQDRTLRTYFGRATPGDGWLAWSRPARTICDFVRAADYAPFPSPWRTPRAMLDDREIRFLKVRPSGRLADVPPGIVGPPEGPSVLVAAGDEWVVVERITADGLPAPPSEVLPPSAAFSWNE